MCDGRVSSTEKTVQSVAPRVPKIMVQRVEDILPAVKESVDCLDSEKDGSVSCSEACSSSSHSGAQAINIKVEEIQAMEDRENPVSVSFGGLGAEHEKDVAGPHNEACAAPSHDRHQEVNIKVEEFSDMEDGDDPAPMTFMEIKFEHEDSLDSQKDVPGSHSEACVSPSHLGNQAVSIKVEEFSHVQDEEDPVPMAVVEIKVEPEVCVDSQKDSPDSCVETCPPSSYDADHSINIKVEEISDVEVEEDPLKISLTGVETEHANEHRLMHGECPFSWDVCNKSFNQRGHLKVRQREHSGERRFSCDVCNKSFSRHGHLKEHQRIHSGERPYSCNVCNKAFSQRNHLKGHERIHSGERPYACEVCSKSFSRHSHLKEHQYTHSGERAFPCDVCHKSYTTNNVLKVHRRIHSEVRPFSCAVCNKSYISKSQLRVHLRTHSGERPFSCHMCDKSYTCSSELKIHQRIHTGEQPYFCGVCNKSFRRNSHLKVHQQRIHRGEQPFSCDVCNKSFSGHGHLRDHQRIHSGERPFSCASCNKSFTYKCVLKNHLRVCSESQPFSSDLCDELYTQHNLVKMEQGTV